MKSLLEAVAIILLFFVAPAIVVRVLVGLAQVIDKIGELPLEESETLADCDLAEKSEEVVHRWHSLANHLQTTNDIGDDNHLIAFREGKPPQNPP